MKGQVFAIIGVLVLITMIMLRVEVTGFGEERTEPMLSEHLTNLAGEYEKAAQEGLIAGDMQDRLDGLFGLSSGFFEQRGFSQEAIYSYCSGGDFVLGNYLGKDMTGVTVVREGVGGTEEADLGTVSDGTSVGHAFSSGWTRITVNWAGGSFSYSGDATAAYLDAKLGYEGSYLRQTETKNMIRWHDERH